HVAEALPELDLVDARLADVAADRQQSRAGRLVGPEFGVGGAAVVDDPGDGGERLDVVEQGRPAPRALDGGEGGTRAAPGALAREGCEECCLLAADVRPGVAAPA